MAIHMYVWHAHLLSVFTSYMALIFFPTARIATFTLLAIEYIIIFSPKIDYCEKAKLYVGVTSRHTKLGKLATSWTHDS